MLGGITPAQAQYVASTKGDVNLRASASTTAAKVGTLAKEDLIPCLEFLDGIRSNTMENRPMCQNP